MTDKRGRPRKSTAEHVAAGTLRPDRHSRVGPVKLVPRPGPDLDDGLLALVTHVAEHPPSWLTEVDRPALRLLQELVAERQDLIAELDVMPPFPETRKNLRAIGSEIAGLLHALGLTAYGRNRLGVVVEPEQASRLDKLRAAVDERSSSRRSSGS